jgi:hypothetical protein
MTIPARMDPRLVVEMRPVNANPRRRKVARMSCTPVPTAAQKRTGFSGKRNTSPWISFHPDCKKVRSCKKRRGGEFAT